MDKTEAVRYNPVDRGWAWAILLSAFMSHFVAGGLMKSYGVLFVAIQIRYDTSATMVSMLGALESAFFSIAALLCLSVFLGLVSVRMVSLLGVSIGCCGMVLSSLVSDVNLFLFTFSVCLGVAKGMTLPLSITMLNFYFKQKLPFATGIANLGSSLGCFFLPMGIRWMLDNFSLPGTFLLLGGLYAQLFIFGALLTPPSDYKPNSLVRPKLKPSSLLIENDKQTMAEQSKMKDERLAKNGIRSFSETAVNELTESEELTGVEKPLMKSAETINGHQVYSRFQHHHPQRDYRDLKTETMPRNNSIPGMDPDAYQSLAASPEMSNPALSISEKDATEEERGLINAKANLGEPDEYRSKSQNPNTEHHPAGQQRTWERIRNIFDVGLLRNRVFWVLITYNYVACLLCCVALAYLPGLAWEKGLNVTQGALLVTIAGGLDLVSRPMPAFVVQSKLLGPHSLVAIALALVGSLFQFTALTNGMAAMVCVAAVLGLFGGTYFTTMGLIVIDFTGLDKFRQVYGVVQLAIGAGGLTGFIVVGYLKDVTGTYVSSFHFMGCSGLLAAVIVLTLPILQRRKTRSFNRPAL